MTMHLNILIEKDQEGYIASVSNWKGCYTAATSLDVLFERLKEAIAVYTNACEPLDYQIMTLNATLKVSEIKAT